MNRMTVFVIVFLLVPSWVLGANYIRRDFRNSAGEIIGSEYIKNNPVAPVKRTAEVAGKGALVRKTVTVGVSKGNLIVGAVCLMGGIAWDMWGKDKVSDIQAWMATAGVNATPSGLTKAGPVTQESNNATCQASYDSGWAPSGWGAGARHMRASGVECSAMSATWHAQWGYSNVGSAGGTSPDNRWDVSGDVYNPNPGESRYLCFYPHSGGGCEGTVQMVPGPPVPATKQDLQDMLDASIEAGQQQATDLIKQVQKIIQDGINQDSTPESDTPKEGDSAETVMIKTPSPMAPTAGQTTKQVTDKQVTDQIPPEELPEEPEIGTVTSSENEPYIDPAYTGVFNLAPWPQVESFADRWDQFRQQIQSSQLFSLASTVGQVPSGGNSVISFDAGIYGNHTVDFSTWPPIIFSILSGIVLLGSSWLAIKIVTLKGGS